jgi:diacylglycerol kinase family enzyme
MYYYIYDAYLADKKYQQTLAKIETRLTDLGISGKINRLSFSKNIGQILKEEVKRGLKTIVVVGNDKTLGNILNLLPDISIPLGIIPIGNDNAIANTLGIFDSESACEILASRIVERVDVGMINNYYFLTALSIENQGVILNCENSYFVEITDTNHIIEIINLDTKGVCSPIDGQLDTYLKQKQQKLWRQQIVSTSHFKQQNLNIASATDQSVSVTIHDEQRIIKTPATITLLPKKLRLIVGKNRSF